MCAGTKPIPFVLIINRTTFHLQLQSKPLITKGLPRYIKHWAACCSLTRGESFSVLSLLCSWSLVSTAIIPTRISVRSHTAKSGLLVKEWGKQQPNIRQTILVLHTTVLYCIRLALWISLQLNSFQSAMLPGVVIKGAHWMKPFFAPMTSYGVHIPPYFQETHFVMFVHTPIRLGYSDCF